MTKKILVVDDDTNSLRLAESILKSNGYEVVALNDPQFIFKVIKSEKPDLIVSDIIMPHIDGYTLCQELKKIYHDKIPVILCTAKSYEQELIERAYKEFGAAGFIIKPFKENELLEQVQRVLLQKPPVPDAS